MKKWLLILLALLVLVIAGLYIFIPSTITIRKTTIIEASKDGLLRKLGNTRSWNQWWPEIQSEKDTSPGYTLNGIDFTPGLPKTLSIPLTISIDNFTTTSELTFIPERSDSTTIHIETSVPVSNNPFKRLSSYFKSKKLENSLATILQAIDNKYSKTQNLYDYDIQKQLVVDSILVFTSEETKGYPSVDKVYSLIDELKAYIKQNDALETGLPMQNIFRQDSVNYLLKVAIPVNKKLPETEKFHYRWMLPGGNILITEVKGGQHAINDAYKQIQNYISDYRRVAPAIPFESLVTDRRNEPDTNKWITRIYYPVM